MRKQNISLHFFKRGYVPRNHTCQFSPAFTVVELLVVIVIIGLLATITVIQYIGITQKTASLTIKSDLIGASKQLRLFQVERNAYPTDIDCAQPDSPTNKCIKPSIGITYTYQPDNSVYPQTFSLYAARSNVIYRITSDSPPQPVSIICPLNFVVVPGSPTYGKTNDFCVMKYNAKQVGTTTTPISEANGLPWVNISQNTAAVNSANVAGCTGCHLITEAEWMTLARNALSVPSNWSSGAVGSGYIYSGHNDGIPDNPIAADTNDDNGYINTGNTTGNQRRTLTLSNGEIIWDLAGNVFEWTSGTVTTGQPGINGNGLNEREWTDITNPGTLTPNPSPTATGISGAGSWNSSNGIGKVFSNADEVGLRGFVRSFTWFDNSRAGVLSLYLGLPPTVESSMVGFRVAQ